MKDKPYIISSVSINNEKRYVLFKITKTCYCTVLVASNIEELMIMLDLNGYDRNEIEFSDERNTMIRNKAKAKVGDIIQWLIMGIAYITIVIDAPLWVTLVVIGVFLLKNELEVYFMNKFQKEL